MHERRLHTKQRLYKTPVQRKKGKDAAKTIARIHDDQPEKFWHAGAAADVQPQGGTKCKTL